MKVSNRLGAALAGCALVASCVSLPPQVKKELSAADGTRPNNYELKHPPESSGFPGFPLHDAQIVLTESGGPESALMSLIPERFYPFSHSGIIAIEEGQAVVYEARGAYKTGGGTPADDWFKDESGIRRLPLDEYLAREEYAVVYDPPPAATTSRVVGYARRRYRDKTPFDPYFDATTDDRLYCAELVDDALEAGGWHGPVPVPNRSNPSLRTVLRWWGIRTERTIPVGLLAESLDKAGELGASGARDDALIFNAVKRELHRRFTSDQALGNIFRFDDGLEFRRPVKELLRRATEALDGEGRVTREKAVEEVRRLADAMFGPIGG